MRWLKRTPSAPTSGSNWEKRLTDSGIYLLALGGFYVGWHTIYALALRVAFPQEQAVVVSCLADLAILLYSWKAKQEVEAGRGAWSIRAIVAAMSFATFYLQIRQAWPVPSNVVMHALPPGVWIIGHEMMLRGKLRTARARLRQQQIEAGLKPAPLPSFRATQWMLSPLRTFQAWRLTRLWEVARDVVIAELASKWNKTDRKGKPVPVPVAWRGVLAAASTTPSRPAPALPAAPAAAVFKAPEPPKQLTPAPKKPEPKTDSTPPPVAPFKARVRLTNGQDATIQQQMTFHKALPTAPAAGRTAQEALAYIDEVVDVAATYGIRCTGVLLAELLDCSETYICHIRRDRKRQLAGAAG